MAHPPVGAPQNPAFLWRTPPTVRHRILPFCGAPFPRCATEFYRAHLHVGPPTRLPHCTKTAKSQIFARSRRPPPRPRRRQLPPARSTTTTSSPPLHRARPAPPLTARRTSTATPAPPLPEPHARPPHGAADEDLPPSHLPSLHTGDDLYTALDNLPSLPSPRCFPFPPPPSSTELLHPRCL